MIENLRTGFGGKRQISSWVELLAACSCSLFPLLPNYGLNPLPFLFRNIQTTAKVRNWIFSSWMFSVTRFFLVQTACGVRYVYECMCSAGSTCLFFVGKKICETPHTHRKSTFYETFWPWPVFLSWGWQQMKFKLNEAAKTLNWSKKMKGLFFFTVNLIQMLWGNKMPGMQLILSRPCMWKDR